MNTIHPEIGLDLTGRPRKPVHRIMWRRFKQIFAPPDPFSKGIWLRLGAFNKEPATVEQIHGWVVKRANGDEEILLYDGCRMGMCAQRDKLATTAEDMLRLQTLSYATQNPITSFRMVSWYAEREE